jgi:hypothetical protein
LLQKQKGPAARLARSILGETRASQTTNQQLKNVDPGINYFERASSGRPSALEIT